MAETPATCIEYDILGDDTIADVRGDWEAFAAENGAPGLTVVSVLGRSLWDYVAGMDVRSVYRMIVEHVRATGRPKRFNFNCDDSTHIRHFRLEVSRVDSQTVRFNSTLLELQPRPVVPLFEPMATRADDDILTVCSVCKCVECEGAWLPVEEALARLHLMRNPVMPQISHGLCPACFDTMQRELDTPPRRR